MKGIIHQVKNHKDSESQAKVCYDSFKKFGHDVVIKDGITPNTIKEYDVYDVLKNSRLESFLKNDKNERKHLVKKSCVLNNIQFCKKVIEKDEPMMFLEHDALCVSPFDNIDFDEFVYLAIEYWNKPPSGLALRQFVGYNPLYKIGVSDFPNDWPLTYYKETIHKGSKLTPGTMCYGLTPKGAKKIIHNAEKYGLEQSDYIINSSVVRLQYVYPSLAKQQSTNLNLSHKL